MPAPPAPVITGPAVAYADRDEPFRYLISASSDPVLFSARGLPDGLRLDRRSGLISGEPAETGRFTVVLTAANATASVSAPLPLTVGTPPPEPWSYGDVGDVVLDERRSGTFGVAAVHAPGITTHDGGVFTVRGAGPDLNVNGQGWTGQFARVPITGDRTLTARVVSRTGAVTADRVGLLMAKSTSPFDQAAGAVVSSTGSAEAGTPQLLLRKTVAGATTTIAGSGPVRLPLWLRLTRTGTTFTADVSSDGLTWTPIGQGTIPAFGDAPYYAGLVVCSHDPAAQTTALFDHVSVTQTTS
ncbi:putative Ig domain-containing protein [Actinoallomurus sp. NPDC050550]|uniref:putative Ig domain-containing protein n=1 Tax=Actinoallomurus sp. NPDC050550 TaxID=3154937 RepID=UPI0033ED8975